LCCVCFYFVALDVSLGFHFLLYVCYVNPAYGCQIEINCVCVSTTASWFVSEIVRLPENIKTIYYRNCRCYSLASATE